ncbi:MULTISPECIES: Asp-tRNA(Asn)/Glu-tRNA(Gln) amidotransferase subunit GatB [Thermodesulfobacterium]|jgi:aspartyl-tRNA(Asn)/glutamyl-tRNA(Gln) amidotransferase subunit B|uniref:Aspartyl/glutamyl-tRNA(Asn/Gln) amidotransferase subunit B n=2 Tax=Thermodesulfobacterium commune TaxID=1741 RepID=A0A075WZ06_9BACT|nr:MULTISPECIES: Asp-tRNA(Asn)/Glu-tRNA(Gln) amidotransferase subunit GatB [Thermodesulfobacterium]KUJ98340.1 MAG: Aspartyl/glutamyl-tRNA(Asn/Gln) amidotransferase subunit B [Thermodesulfobacterium sp. 37_54]KUK19931.1 MAG: Aspartyl/glutamyl-tRNA(Asn/Gln) amidotransferase subunit B [Thermodesulfobacterium commune]AIH03902.1 glutamyl-tRNA amidotransferase [Thermodesulfobacterium commune DSM 2178]KUK37701.1 MAG: Aspartyl/glutamyl-tRNA(Asn/Gln) amidotransferase subunit B [Thermodesulfobacterium co
MEFEAVIGLEVHAQLNTKTKMFCSCSTKFGNPPNTQICPICTGQPGVLPVINKRAVEFAIKLGLALGCKINKTSVMARKNYFYPDLPKGYQISQYELPIAEGGEIEIEINGTRKIIPLVRIHMEEDAGKLIHDEKQPFSYVDFNRCGTPLLEIVSAPAISSPEEAVAYLKTLRRILRYLGICDGNMEEGSLRCDANVSVRPKGSDKFGTKVELKNMNSFKHVEKALSYEIKRQIGLLLEGKTIVQETRLYDEATQTTHPMRGKEEAHDYCYFPDPDLIEIQIDDDMLQKVKNELPELPHVKKQRFLTQYQLTSYEVEILTEERDFAEFFEKTLEIYPNPKMVSNFMLTEVLRYLNRDNISITQSKLTPENLAQLLKLVEDNLISITIAKQVFPEVYEKGVDPKKLVEEKGLIQESSEEKLKIICEEVLRENPAEVEKYKAGKKGLLGFFVGQVLKKTQGKANPKVVNKLLEELLEK